MAHKVSFDELKAQITVAECAAWCGIKLKANRGDCPLCGHERSFTITPDKAIFGCFHCKVRGSILDMVHHVKQTANVRDAALMIQEHFLGGSSTTSSTSPHMGKRTVPVSTPKGRDEGELKPLDYLTADHEALEALGISAAACGALGVGFAPKGTMRGRVVFPLRLPNGKLVAYIGLATNAEMSPLLLVPKNLDQMIEAPVAQEKPEQAASDIKSFLRVVK